MTRETTTATAFGAGILLVVAIGGWIVFGPSAGDTPPTERDTSSSVARDVGPAAAPHDGGPGTVAIPMCPFAIRLDGSFRRTSDRDDRRSVHLVSERRDLTVKASCRTADKNFDRQGFLDRTLDAVDSRFEGELAGKKTETESGPASGWTTWTRVRGRFRFFNVLVVDRTVITIHVFGPAVGSTREFNARLLHSKLDWPGDAPARDAGSRSSDSG